MKSLAVVAFAGIALIVALACGSTPASPGSEETPGPASEQPTGAEPDGPDMVEEPAPIDDVTVSATSDSPPEYVVHIKSGLPNGCHRFKGHEVSREGDTVKITVTNLKPADGLVACTMIYGTVETTIELGSDFDPGQSYKIDVNGAVSDLKAPASSQTVIEEAPIESVQIAVSQGQPAKNEMVIVLGLPDSCHEFVGYELDGEDDTFRIVVRNSRLTGPDVACAEIYRTVETRIDLGEDVEVCKAYTVVAGDEEYLVQAIAPNVRCKAPEVGADTVPVPPALAPIEDVSIRTTRSIPAQYTLVIRSRLPNSCVRFGGYSTRQTGDTILVAVTNLTDQKQGQACAQVYATVETTIDLGTEFYSGTTYTVYVNEAEETFEGVNAPPDNARNMQPAYETVFAPIESLEVITAESVPPQYILAIKSGLPNGCVRFETYRLERQADAIRVSVTNLVPGLGVICAQVYSTVDTYLALGSQFEEGLEYTVQVNDVIENFTPAASTGQGGEDGDAPGLGRPFQLSPGESATIGSDGLKVEFLEIVEESRCAVDVTCIQAGRALVRVAVGDEKADLTLEAGGTPYLPGETAGAYAAALIALDPYPDTRVQPKESDIKATVLVTRKPDVEMTLTAAPVEGTARDFKFDARILGGPPNYKTLFCAGYTWDFGDGINVSVQPACAQWSAETRVLRRLTEQHKYQKAGSYEISLTVETFGERLRATTTATVD